MKILVMIPAYNEEESINEVVNNIKSLSEEIDYLVINDCSKDNTKKILEEMKANYLDLPINLGIGGGVQSGYMYALYNDYDIAIQMDGDGQHDCSYIYKLIEPIIADQADMVIGSRFINKEGFQSSFTRRMGINFLSFVIRCCCGLTVKDTTSGFRAVNKKLIKLFVEDYAQDYPEPEAIVSAAINNARILEVPVVMHERSGGKSSISTIKSIYYMIKVSLGLILQKLILGKRR